mmetsp:Transcript_23786/g.33293  ORF Transcript_23786/g.33293 Transcript_23786/m.33293 type:complete len:364 (-) Transcript_23786:248-1339(-)|eukprot:CAMPEP_0184481412 /NCGR_PEP_ID=MMETSP0113_2-20130426/2953_1 /TAXON_ID=91329 /ORGANISM="Norrisiella sphaerica, Strain BC52" /LENGTH=363 /DNA_ID=CAMNT_0026860523 /DNA_START=189 /DNA_END=1280 /DNA_ORIENTATION=+
MPRFGKSSRFAKTRDGDQPLSKDFASMGMIHNEPKGARIVKATRPQNRDSFLKGSLRHGYYCPEEKSTNQAEIGYLQFHTHGKPLPSLKERSKMKGPQHPNDDKAFNASHSTWTKDKRFNKTAEETNSPGPVYLPQVAVTSQMKRSPGFAYGTDRDGGMAVINKGPVGKQIVKPRSRDRAWFLSAKMGAGGYMYKIEDPSEIADVGHAVNRDVSNDPIYTKVTPSVAGLGKAQRFPAKSKGAAPGPKYTPSYNIDSRKSSPLAHRFGTRFDKRMDRSKAMATGILKSGVMLHQGPGNINDVGPGHYAPKRLFDNVKKQIDFGFGEAQMEWKMKQKKMKEEAAKRKRGRRKKKKSIKSPKSNDG